MQRNKISLTLIAAACSALVLSACGGGGGATATVTPAELGSPTVSGTVTGFGSVIVDGVRVDDHAVIAGTELEDGTVQNTELKIGQHVDITHDGNLVAKQIRVRPEIKGVVEKVDSTAGTLTIFGHTIAINTDATLGPVTVFEAPYTKLADVKVGDGVEIHGIIKIDATGKVSLQATRIEKNSVGLFNRIKGTVTALSTTASTFKIGDLLINYANARILPTPATLFEGAEVLVSIPVAPSFTGTAINAGVIKIRKHRDENKDLEAKLAGLIGNIDATAKSFMLDGVKVDAAQAEFEQSGKSFADLKQGLYMRVKGTYQADGLLKAKTIVLRGIERPAGQEVELHGSILNFQSNASFTLRGITIDASNAAIACPTGTLLANNLHVEVEGKLSAEGKVIAAEVKCEAEQEGQSIIERKGVASQVDPTAKTLVISSSSATTNVQWGDNTLFVGVEPVTLNGKTLEVEGTLSAGVLKAFKIKLKQ